MKTNILKKQAANIYPGIFISGYSEESVNKAITKSNVVIHDIEDVCTHKSTNGWMLKLPFPGKARENFHIRTEDQFLTIYIVQDIWNGANSNKEESMKIELPDCADKPFISASLKNGILSVFIPICDNPLENDNSNIMVY